VLRLSPPERCLIVGAPDSVEPLRRKLRSGQLRVSIAGTVPLETDGTGTALVTAAWLRRVAHDHEVDRMVIVPAATQGPDTLDLIRLAKAAGVRVSVLPRLLEVVGSSVTFDEIDGLPLLAVPPFGLSRSSRLLKRAFDIVVAAVMLVAVAPVLAGLALAVRLDSPGPVLWRETRIGKGGSHFTLLKFRTFIAETAPEARDRCADPPRTRLGALICSTCLDELPQLLNVLRGDMSLVGPRPLILDEDAKVTGLDRARLVLSPGITGHWQTLGPTRLPLDEMTGIDYLYVANWTLWTDCKILLRTVVYVLSRRGV
jgi:lipopolysaccharide/colanic/teichoic acid biosynthesis glycosyltransferase